MDFPCISHHGVVNGVTGSCHQLHLDAWRSVLVDCGLYQGADSALGARPLPFVLQGFLVLAVTQVHLDHVGRIPELILAGYRGRSSAASRLPGCCRWCWRTP